MPKDKVMIFKNKDKHMWMGELKGCNINKIRLGTRFVAIPFPIYSLNIKSIYFNTYISILQEYSLTTDIIKNL